jgi:phospholipase D-like protein
VNSGAYSYLGSHRVTVTWSSPEYRYTHQKTVIIDGAKAVIMTANLTSRYYATSRDFLVIDTERADVSAITVVFDADFTGQASRPGDGSHLVWSPTDSEGRLLGLINGARSSLRIYSKEMGDRTVENALVKAAERGVMAGASPPYGRARQRPLQPQRAARGQAGPGRAQFPGAADGQGDGFVVEAPEQVADPLPVIRVRRGEPALGQHSPQSVLDAGQRLHDQVREVVDRMHGDLPGGAVRHAHPGPVERGGLALDEGDLGQPPSLHRQTGRSSPAGTGGTEPDGASTGASAGTVSG